MEKTILIRPTKFPFIFWAFSKATKANLDTEKEIIKLEGTEKEFKYELFGKWKFIFLKYSIFLLIFPLVFRINDFSLSLEKIIQYFFALFFSLSILLLRYNSRQFALFFIFVLSALVSFWTGDLWLTAYAIKYCIFLMLFIVFVVDTEYYAYSAKFNGKVVFNFLSLKKVEDLPTEDEDLEKNFSKETK